MQQAAIQTTFAKDQDEMKFIARHGFLAQQATKKSKQEEDSSARRSAHLLVRVSRLESLQALPVLKHLVAFDAQAAVWKSLIYST